MKSGSIAILYSLLKEDKEGYYRDVRGVETALRRLGYHVNKIPVGRDVGGLLSKIKQASPRCIFNLCEEVGGDSWGEVYVAGFLELLGIPYTGTGPIGLALSLDKAKTKDVLSSHGINVPGYQVFNNLRQFSQRNLRFPLIVKPVHEDGSYGIDRNSLIYTEKGFLNKFKAIRKRFKEPVIVEQYIDGRELNVSILGNGKNLQVLPISEIDYSIVPRICTYNAKWRDRSKEYKSTVPVCPARLSKVLRKRIEDIAIKAYSIMRCRDYARIDIRLDKNRIPYIIDVNPNPCLGLNSGFVRSSQKAGLGYVELIGGIIDVCIKRSSRN